MADWLSWAGTAMQDAPSFDEMSLRVSKMPAYRGIPTVDAIETRMSEEQALIFIANRLLGESSMRAAARRVYDSNWIVRQATVALLSTMSSESPT